MAVSFSLLGFTLFWDWEGLSISSIFVLCAFSVPAVGLVGTPSAETRIYRDTIDEYVTDHRHLRYLLKRACCCCAFCFLQLMLLLPLSSLLRMSCGASSFASQSVATETARSERTLRQNRNNKHLSARLPHGCVLRHHSPQLFLLLLPRFCIYGFKKRPFKLFKVCVLACTVTEGKRGPWSMND